MLHIVRELPAVISFAFFLSATLLIPQSYAQAVIHQYTLLLLALIIIAAILSLQDRRGDGPKMPELSVASALALYHLGPLIRAAHRSWRG